MYSCNKLDCQNKCTTKCSGCKIAHYCSPECQKKDWLIHKQMCFALLSDRLRAFCEITTRNKARAAHLSMTVGIHPLDTNTLFYYLSCFPKMKLKFFNSWCVVCSGEAIWDYDTSSTRSSHVFFAGRSIPYLRCMSCETLQRTLCHTTFMESAVCRANSIAKIIHLFMYRHCDVLPLTHDVFNVIITYAIDLLDCKHCLI